jgi:hypothetical protein
MLPLYMNPSTTATEKFPQSCIVRIVIAIFNPASPEDLLDRLRGDPSALSRILSAPPAQARIAAIYASNPRRYAMRK